MFFLLFGWGDRVKELGDGAVRTCGRCHNTTTWRRLRLGRQITFFLVPVVRWGRRDVEACPVCGDAHALPVDAVRETLPLHGVAVQVPVIGDHGPHVCPRCGERVSAFAAGCALCGADLDPRRAAGGPTPSQRLRSAWRARRRVLPRIPLPERRR